jgi:hypothetical protein
VVVPGVDRGAVVAVAENRLLDPVRDRLHRVHDIRVEAIVRLTREPGE